MFGIGGPELVFIFVLALLIFGPKRLPQIGRTIGKGMAEFRRASTELQRAVNTQLEEPPATPSWRTPAAAPVLAPVPSAGSVAQEAEAQAADAAPPVTDADPEAEAGPPASAPTQFQ